jgi:putative PLP-dependent aminotransferase (TIGR04422 family)
MIKNNKYFLWPKPQYPVLSDLFRSISTEEVEGVIRSYWPDVHPVIFSSARSGLTAILQNLNLSRSDLVWCPPYSSHCVFESISRVATPITIQSKNIKVAVIYHQWGFSSSHQWPNSTVIIEDSVDTLFLPNSNIFSSGGDYVIQSLPKVYGCIGGGVIFCRNANDAKNLKMIRKTRGTSRFQTMLRILSHKSSTAYLYWHGAESLHGGISSVALSQIFIKINSLPLIVNERLEFLNKISPLLKEYVVDTGRIPSNIPIILTPVIENIWNNSGIFSAGLRNFNIGFTSPNVKWKIVAPLPLHIDVHSDELYKVFPLLGCKVKNEVKDELGFL